MLSRIFTIHMNIDLDGFLVSNFIVKNGSKEVMESFVSIRYSYQDDLKNFDMRKELDTYLPNVKPILEKIKH